MVLDDARFFHLAQQGAAFLHLGECNGKQLARDFEIQPRHFRRGLRFLHIAKRLLQVRRQAVSGIPQLDPQVGNLDLRLRHLRAHARAAQQRQLERNAQLHVVALEFLEEIGVVVEFGEHAVLRHQIDLRPPRGVRAAHFQTLGDDLRFELPQFLAGFERCLDGLLLGWRQGRRAALLRHRPHALLGGEADGHGQRRLGRGLVGLQALGGLARARQIQGRLLFRQRQGAAFPHQRPDGFHNLLQAFGVFARQSADARGAFRIQVQRRRAIGHLVPLARDA